MKLIKLLYRKPFVYILPDKLHLKLMYRFRMKRRLDFSNLRTFNEKMQWIKLYDRNPVYSMMADKIEARKYIEKKIGAEYLIPLIGTYDSADEIDFSKLPGQFAIKCNHDSKSAFICTDKKNTDIEAVRTSLNKKLERNYHYYFREWAYKNIKRRIICEKYMIDRETNELRDYRFYCFNGEPKLISVDFDKSTVYKRNSYTADWEFIDVRIKHPNAPDRNIQKPDQLDKLIELSRVLAFGITFLRVDFYLVDGKIYSGELTFYPAGGYTKYIPDEFDLTMGSMLDLPVSK